MNNMPAEFIEVLSRAAYALNTSAYALQQEPEYCEKNIVGDILRKTAELSLQDADVLTGFVERWKKAQEK